MKAELKEIERLTLLNDGYEAFDTWGNDTRSMLYFFLINEFKEKKHNYFTGENGHYIVYYRSSGRSMGGMLTGSPDTMIVVKTNEYPKQY
jgi:hypothetical protein